MRWYKFSIVLAIGLLIELIVATISCLLIKQNSLWLSTLTLPVFAPKSFLFYSVIMEVDYLSTAVAFALYAKRVTELPKGAILCAIEGISEIVTLLFFFRFTYEITSFFLATVCMILSVAITGCFLKKNDPAGIARLPNLTIHVYLWTVIYCIVMLNFT